MLQSHGLLKYHTVAIPLSKGDLLKATLQGDPVKYWPHWTAVIQEKKTGQRYAVDFWIYANGENPAVVKVEDWYIKDIANLPKADQLAAQLLRHACRGFGQNCEIDVLIWDHFDYDLVRKPN